MESAGRSGLRNAARSLRAIRPAIRGPAVRCGGWNWPWGEGAAERTGLVLAYEAFQGGDDTAVDARRAHLKSPTVAAIRRVHHASRAAPTLRRSDQSPCNLVDESDSIIGE